MVFRFAKNIGSKRHLFWRLALILSVMSCSVRSWACQPNQLPLHQAKVEGQILYYQYFHKAGSKRPTVVFESGRGDDHSIWNKVVLRVCAFANTFTYDRLNTGKSQDVKKAITAKDVAIRLKKLLDNQHINPPYLIKAFTYMRIMLVITFKLINRILSLARFIPSTNIANRVFNLREAKNIYC